MPAASPLRIAVIGVGKIGSAFAFQLARVGRHDVTAIARPGSARFRQLERDQGIVDIKGERAILKITDTFDDQTPYDLVIVTLLAHQVDAVLPALRRSAAKCIQFMFVTFEAERLQDAVGANRCSFGMPFVQSLLDEDGKLKATIGTAGQKTKMSQQRWVDVFKAAGMPAAFEPDMPLWLRCQVPMCVAFESVSVAGERRGGGASWREALVLARGMREGFALIEALGDRLYPKSKARVARLPLGLVATVLWTLSRIRSFRVLLATGKDECRALVDVMVESAQRSAVSVNTAAITAMKPA